MNLKNTPIDYKGLFDYKANNAKYGSEPIIKYVTERLDVARIDFHSNVEYLLAYTGMSKSDFYRALRSHGVKRAKKQYEGIVNRTEISFDLYLVAAVSAIFKLHWKLLITVDIKEKNIDLNTFKLRKNEYAKRRWTGVRHDKMMNEASWQSSKVRLKRLSNVKANEKDRVINFWDEFSNITT